MGPTEAQAGQFWDGKEPCWVSRGCPPYAHRLCSAFQDQSKPCWQHEDTLCKKLLGVDTCFVCAVFRRYAPQGERQMGRQEDDLSSGGVL